MQFKDTEYFFNRCIIKTSKGIVVMFLGGPVYAYDFSPITRYWQNYRHGGQIFFSSLDEL